MLGDWDIVDRTSDWDFDLTDPFDRVESADIERPPEENARDASMAEFLLAPRDIEGEPVRDATGVLTTGELDRVPATGVPIRDDDTVVFTADPGGGLAPTAAECARREAAERVSRGFFIMSLCLEAPVIGVATIGAGILSGWALTLRALPRRGP